MDVTSGLFGLMLFGTHHYSDGAKMSGNCPVFDRSQFKADIRYIST